MVQGGVGLIISHAEGLGLDLGGRVETVSVLALFAFADFSN